MNLTELAYRSSSRSWNRLHDVSASCSSFCGSASIRTSARETPLGTLKTPRDVSGAEALTYWRSYNVFLVDRSNGLDPELERALDASIPTQ